MIRNYTADLKGFYKKIFDNSDELKTALYSYNITEDLGDFNSFHYDIIKIFLEDSSFKHLIENINTIKEAFEGEMEKYRNNTEYEKESPLYKIQISILEHFEVYAPWVSFRFYNLYIQIIYTFLYGSVKGYFYENRKRFLPEYDWFLIENNELKKTHIESFFREFDRFSDEITYLTDIKDIDEAPEDKIAYLSAVIGIKFDLEKDTEGYVNILEGTYKIDLLSVSKIRNLLKRIVEVYRLKGSRFAYEIFFNSIGIDISLKETYFDRRLYWRSENENDNINPETSENKVSEYAYYLTSKNPAIHYNSLTPSEIVRIEDMTSPKNESSFKKIFEKNDSDILKTLGYSTSSEETFTYFKTNVLVLDFKYFLMETQEESYISSKHLEILKAYIDMITPIYIKKYHSGFRFAESVFLDRVNLLFRTGSGYISYYDKDGKYRERERSESNIVGRKTEGSEEDSGEETNINSFDLGYGETEGYPKEEEYDEIFDVSHKTTLWEESTKKTEKIALGFDKTYVLEEAEESYYSFETGEGNILNNIDFTWLPKVEDYILAVEDGYFILDYFSYGNPIVAVSVKNIPYEEDSNQQEINKDITISLEEMVM